MARGNGQLASSNANCDGCEHFQQGKSREFNNLNLKRKENEKERGRRSISLNYGTIVTHHDMYSTCGNEMVQYWACVIFLRLIREEGCWRLIF